MDKQQLMERQISERRSLRSDMSEINIQIIELQKKLIKVKHSYAEVTLWPEEYFEKLDKVKTKIFEKPKDAIDLDEQNKLSGGFCYSTLQ